MPQGDKVGSLSATNFLLLDPTDNILICTASTPKGTNVLIGGACVILPAAIDVGHKIARFALSKGDQIRRYGFPIGTMTEDAAAGSHVHQHNLKSDYLPAHGRGGAEHTGEA
jgi:hypothetical protein